MMIALPNQVTDLILITQLATINQTKIQTG